MIDFVFTSRMDSVAERIRPFARRQRAHHPEEDSMSQRLITAAVCLGLLGVSAAGAQSASTVTLAGQTIPTRDSAVVGSLGLFRSDLTRLAERSPEMARTAARIQRDWTVGRSAVAVGTVLVVGAIARYSRGPNPAGGYGMRTDQLAAFVTGGAIATFGGWRMTSARDALESAMRR
jgi:hypothetical protein